MYPVTEALLSAFCFPRGDVITEFDFTRLYQWTMGQHDGFICPYCKQQIPPNKKHTVYLTSQDTYLFCDISPELDSTGGNDGSITRSG